MAGAEDVRPFEWTAVPGTPAPAAVTAGGAPVPARAPAPLREPAVEAGPSPARQAEIEREAFARGYEQGERAGFEAGGKRAEATLRRLAQTLEELGELRRVMIRQTERQMVELALAIARRIVRREVALDQDLTLTLARVALDRLGESTSVSVHLHPDDYAATAAKHADRGARHVTVVADPAVHRGGCFVESDFGFVDTSVDAQFQELARALLAEEGHELAAVNTGDR